MNIAFVNSTHKWGGVKSWCLAMAQALEARGHATVTCGRPGAFVDKARALGLEAHAVDFGPDFSPALIAFFLREFRQRRVDALVVNIGKDLRTAGVAARLLGIPILQHIGQAGDLRGGLKTRLTMQILRPLLVACCRDAERGVRAALPWLPPGRVTTIDNGVAVAPAPDQTVRTPRTFITTSQLNPDKGHADLLAAYAALAAQGRDFAAVILGRGDSEAELRGLAQALGLSGRVRFEGFQTDVRAFLRRADAFVLPSLAEGLPLSLEEAMAEGLVPVARAVGGVAEVWPPELPRLLVDPRPGPEALLRALETVLNAPDDELLAWKRAAWEHCRRCCDVADKAARLEAAILAMQEGRG